MTKIIWDKSEPAVNEMVSGWADKGEYVVRLKIRQDSSTPNITETAVLEATDETPSEEAAPVETSEVETASPAPKSKPAVQVKY